jgi:hypothetical protein
MSKKNKFFGMVGTVHCMPLSNMFATKLLEGFTKTTLKG